MDRCHMYKYSISYNIYETINTWRVLRLIDDNNFKMKLTWKSLLPTDDVAMHDNSLHLGTISFQLNEALWYHHLMLRQVHDDVA